LIFSRLIPLCFIAIIFSSCASLPSFRTSLILDPSVERQFIEVIPSGNSIFTARLTAWTYTKGRWHAIMGPWPAVIGRNGFALSGSKIEGDGKTPSGLYPIGIAFGREAVLKTGLYYRQATERDLWVDDVLSPQYNQWVSGSAQASSYENMLRSDGLYDAGAVIEYNTSPVVAGKGSAIFIHIWRDRGAKPTAGCVALDGTRLRQLLSWLRADLKPVIVLGSAGERNSP
jgi:L,D-peptidoglycan transpeptidase YkuD (ErfK/YbiS/YcfS/YnhG family)